MGCEKGEGEEGGCELLCCDGEELDEGELIEVLFKVYDKGSVERDEQGF